jgi:hypothetical protein
MIHRSTFWGIVRELPIGGQLRMAIMAAHVPDADQFTLLNLEPQLGPDDDIAAVRSFKRRGDFWVRVPFDVAAG